MEARATLRYARISPHGGGEGRAPVGHDSPRTPWGKPAMGLKTRKHHARSNKFIVKRANG